MRLVPLLFIFVLFLQAENIEITSKKFEASEKELISKFLGNVIVKRDKDRIEADEVIIFFNKKHKPIKIVTKGNVKFTILDSNGKQYNGSAKYIIYFPNKKEYLLQGDVHIVQVPEKKKLFAQEIYLNLQNSKLIVKGSNSKPVKMIINIEEK